MLTRSELVESINIGNDIMFDCRGKHFTIIGACKDGPSICIQHMARTTEQIFSDGDDLVDHYMIDGRPLIDWLDQIDITFSS